jgi:hypothetical protein
MYMQSCQMLSASLADLIVVASQLALGVVGTGLNCAWEVGTRFMKSRKSNVPPYF